MQRQVRLWTSQLANEAARYIHSGYILLAQQKISRLGIYIALWTLTAQDGRLATSLGALVKSVGVGNEAVDVGM